ncbi:hypothetical protein CYMTET_24261 [Cymbomonas tetramitiformis]|uniref:Uncharacterized protein n=1 Tax=Cymbomonas tetramitiformis TaxID=36881 RepID=A0AAE0L0E6_9CHLO|nr:hypothetical protein CYMTET_24261 [Cymbomonas tetramitiformis]
METPSTSGIWKEEKSGTMKPSGQGIRKKAVKFIEERESEFWKEAKSRLDGMLEKQIRETQAELCQKTRNVTRMDANTPALRAIAKRMVMHKLQMELEWRKLYEWPFDKVLKKLKSEAEMQRTLGQHYQASPKEVKEMVQQREEAEQLSRWSLLKEGVMNNNWPTPEDIRQSRTVVEELSEGSPRSEHYPTSSTPPMVVLPPISKSHHGDENEVAPRSASTKPTILWVRSEGGRGLAVLRTRGRRCNADCIEPDRVTKGTCGTFWWIHFSSYGWVFSGARSDQIERCRQAAAKAVEVSMVRGGLGRHAATGVQGFQPVKGVLAAQQLRGLDVETVRKGQDSYSDATFVAEGLLDAEGLQLDAEHASKSRSGKHGQRARAGRKMAVGKGGLDSIEEAPSTLAEEPPSSAHPVRIQRFMSNNAPSLKHCNVKLKRIMGRGTPTRAPLRFRYSAGPRGGESELRGPGPLR